MSATPRLAAVEAWRAGETATIEWPAETLLPDWPTWHTTRQRHAYAVRACSSGAPAELPRRHLVVTEVATGRRIPPPPRRRTSRKPR